MQDLSKKTKKQIIYEEAAKLFREKGYSAASMRDLAERVQLKASSLYSHIGSKEEILQKICLDNAQYFITGMAMVEEMQATMADKIKALLLLHIRKAVEDSTSVTVFNEEWKHLSQPFLAEFLALRKDYENRFKAIIQLGIEKGELRKLHPDILLFSALTSVRWLHYWYKPERNISLTQLEEDMVTMLLDGMCLALPEKK